MILTKLLIIIPIFFTYKILKNKNLLSPTTAVEVEHLHSVCFA